MTDEEISCKLAEIDSRGRSNGHRIERLENDYRALNEMAKSIAVLAARQENVSDKVEQIDRKVSRLEAIPAGRWQALLGYLAAAVCSALVTMLLTRVLR